MLVEFSVGNYKSIKNPVTLSMVASNSVKELENIDEGLNNIFYDVNGKTKYLKSAVIYGANGSGKSNLLHAISFFRRFIMTSSNDRQAEDEIEINPFLFNSETVNLPSSFEMVFVINTIRFRYGFEVTSDIVVNEWLLGSDLTKQSKEATYFVRNNQDIKVNTKNFKEGKGLEIRTRQNALFLSLVAQLEGEISKRIRDWLRTNVNVISGLDDATTGFTINEFQNDIQFRKKIIDFIKLVDLGIEDIQIEEKVINDLMSALTPNKINNGQKIISLIAELQKELSDNNKISEAKEFKINTYHKRFNEVSKLVENVALEFAFESKGTQKLFALLGPWFDTLANGGILIVDELDSRLHTKLSTELLKVFQSNINDKNAQLIFASHDTNLLRNDLFRRDQIWFAEKDSVGATELYSLVEYKINQATSVRNDASFEKEYLMGKYGAIPYFGDIPKFLNEFANESK
jgi:AAA15 family ATPase/GTPase